MTGSSGPIDTVILDVDGTLVDTNYHHALSWYRAFLAHDLVVELWQIHRAIGMGGDRLVAEVASDDVEDRLGDDIRAAWEKEFDALLGEIRPFADAADLMRGVKDRGLRLALASSGKRKHVDAFLDLLDARDIADAWTTSDDAEESKPAPDLLTTALEQVGGTTAVMVGDSVWDSRAAGELGITSIAVLHGGFSREELRKAGAASVLDSLADVPPELDALRTS